MRNSIPDEGPDRTEDAIYAWVQKQMQWTRAVLNRVVKDIEMDGAVGGYLYSNDPPSELIKAAKDAFKRQFPRADARQHKRDLVQSRPTHAEFHRAEIFSLQLGRLARKDAARFRREHLGDKLLSREEARQVLTSELCARANRDDLDKHGIPLASHAAQLVHQDIHRAGSGRNHHQFSATIDVRWSRRSKRIDVQGGLAYLHLTDGLLPLYWAENSVSAEHVIIVWPHSILGRLREVSLKLEKDFPWRAASAAWFVLTGEAPLVFPATASTSRIWRDDFHYYLITVQAQPWVDNPTILELFERQRNQIKVGGKREVGPKALAFMKFFLSKDWDSGDPKVMEKIRREWNQVECKGKPDLHYSASALRTALPRIRSMIMFQQDARLRRAQPPPQPPGPEKKPQRSPKASKKKR